jgi:hypothetical protein
LQRQVATNATIRDPALAAWHSGHQIRPRIRGIRVHNPARVQGIRNQHWCNNWIYVPCLMPTLLPILIPSFECTVPLPHICLRLFWLKLSFSRCDVSNVLVVYKMMPQHCFEYTFNHRVKLFQ